jgi:hypothetical protein
MSNIFPQKTVFLSLPHDVRGTMYSWCHPARRDLSSPKVAAFFLSLSFLLCGLRLEMHLAAWHVENGELPKHDSIPQSDENLQINYLLITTF